MVNTYVRITSTNDYEVSRLIADLGVRYWEDAYVNGIEDVHGDLIPLRSGDAWIIDINVKTGAIANWPKGTTASTHYKVCDGGIYTLIDSSGNVITKRNDLYVPDMLAPSGHGYGDYVILDIDEDGNIRGWEPEFSLFERD